MHLDLKRKARDLSIAEQQMVEIARAFSINARILIMDEPTSSLTLNEVAELFRLVRRLRDEGTAIVFISHRLEELFEIAERVTVLRDGYFVDTKPVKDVTRDELIRLMVGRKVSNMFPKQEAQIGEVILKVEGLTREGVFQDISFELRRGEILGLAGLVGARANRSCAYNFRYRSPDIRENFYWGKRGQNYLAQPGYCVGPGLCPRGSPDSWVDYTDEPDIQYNPSFRGTVYPFGMVRSAC